ncbi:MAG: helix-turn-helix domain-containing protein [Anaerolineales bacterium]|nr:helix-turn-helix domain-containing protein [Anaerolineales bacterium]
MARKKGSKDYPLETKLEAIRLREEEGLLYQEITERLNIRDPGRVKAWMRIYRKEGKAGLKKLRRGRPKKDRDSLEERIKYLEMENTLLKALAIELGEELPEGLDIEPFIDIEGNSE